MGRNLIYLLVVTGLGVPLTQFLRSDEKSPGETPTPGLLCSATRPEDQGPASVSRLVRRFPGRCSPLATPTGTNWRNRATGSASTRVVPPSTEEFPQQQKPADTPRAYRLPGRIRPNMRCHIRHGRSSIGERRCTTIVWAGESNRLAGPAELPVVCEQCENALLSSLRSFFSVRLQERWRNPLRLGQHQP